MKDLETAKKSLLENGYTCVLCKGDEEYVSHSRGVKPLIEFLESPKSFKGFSAADKTVGAGAAHLYVLLGVKAVWANIISKNGKKILNDNNVYIFCEKEVPFIINRTNSGMCPIEKAVEGITDSNEALLKINQTVLLLNKNNK